MTLLSLGAEETVLRTDLRVDAIASSDALVVAGASNLTGRLWSGAIVVGSSPSVRPPIPLNPPPPRSHPVIPPNTQPTAPAPPPPRRRATA